MDNIDEFVRGYDLAGRKFADDILNSMDVKVVKGYINSISIIGHEAHNPQVQVRVREHGVYSLNTYAIIDGSDWNQMKAKCNVSNEEDYKGASIDFMLSSKGCIVPGIGLPYEFEHLDR